MTSHTGLRSVLYAGRRSAAMTFAGLVLASAAVLTSAAQSSGEQAPEFRLPWLSEERVISSGELWSGRDLTALVIWNRGCPHCTAVAMGLGAFADSLEPLGMAPIGILFGPDDPAALEELLWDRGLNVSHLWDEHGAVAARYGLGIQHLGVFLIDRRGTIQARFDHRIPDLFTSVLPAARGWKAEAANRGGDLELPADRREALPPARRDTSGHQPWDPSAIPGTQHESPGTRATILSDRVRLSVDGRAKVLSTEGVKFGDQGLYREALEPGALFLHRWDLRMHWSPRSGIGLVPWLRVSNEPVEALKEGPEQIADPRGSISIRGRAGRLSGTLGAYPLAISPLLLQRWDDEDAPPLGGVSGCGVCGAGASGVRQTSLEILERDYTFEGVHGAYRHRWARLAGWFAVPRWEKRVHLQLDPIADRVNARYRRLLYGTALDMGRASDIDPQTGLARPFGLRVAGLWVEDDRRTVPRVSYYIQPEEQDEQAWMLLAAAGPFAGVRLDGELVWWRVVRRGEETKDRAHRLGLAGAWSAGSSAFWTRLHHLRTGEEYAPYYRAMSYDPNREGWRLAAGHGLRGPDVIGSNIVETTLFLRRVEETEPLSFEDVEGALFTAGKIEETTIGISVTGRPWRDLVVGSHLVRMLTDNPPFVEGQPIPADPDERGTGISLDLQWEAWPSVTPLIRVDRIHRNDGGEEKRDYWQGFVSVRVVM